MGRFRDVEEVLGVAAPELILTTVIKYTLRTGGVFVPLGHEGLLDSAGELNELDLLRSEDTEEEWSFIALSHRLCLDVGHDDVVDGLVVVGGVQPECARDFTLLKALQTLGRLELNIITIDLPKAIPLRFHSHDEEVDGDVGLFAKSEILLHQTDDHLRLLCNGEAVLGVIEPLVIGVEVHLRVLRLLVTIGEGGVGSTVSDVLPLTHDRELLPGAGEDLANVHLVVVLFPCLVVHPPVTIVFELVAELLSQFGLIIPSLILITESSVPLARAGTPRVSNVEELKLLRGCNVFHSEETISVIECDTVRSCSLLSLSIFRLLRFGASD